MTFPSDTLWTVYSGGKPVGEARGASMQEAVRAWQAANGKLDYQWAARRIPYRKAYSRKTTL